MPDIAESMNAIMADLNAEASHWLTEEFGSPAEMAICCRLANRAGKLVLCENQKRVGPYRLDMLMTLFDSRGKRRTTLNIEVDGKAWHDKAKDAARDAWLLQNGIDRIERIPARMLYWWDDRLGDVFICELILRNETMFHPECVEMAKNRLEIWQRTEVEMEDE